MIQSRVDAILATVPGVDRTYGDRSIAGAGWIWVGLGVALLGVLGLLGWRRLVKADWI
jgi:hypothetical protein